MNATVAAVHVMPVWVQYVQVLGAPIVAVFAAIVAFAIQRRQVKIADQMRSIASAQYATADQKLRLELFERRFKVLEGILESIGDTLEYGKSNVAHINAFRNAIAPVRYLFDYETSVYLATEVAEHLRLYMIFTAELERTNDMEMAHKHYDTMQSVERDWLSEQHHELHVRMGKYLSVKAVGDLS